MNLDRAKTIARDIMNYHGLNQWSISFDNALARLGQCKYADRAISLGRHATTVNSEDQVVNTILHEVAHALVGPGNGHNKVWKYKFISIGGDGKRTSKIAVQATPKYQISCSNCSSVYSYYRRPRFNLAEGYCSKVGCGPSTKGKLVLTK